MSRALPLFAAVGGAVVVGLLAAAPAARADPLTSAAACQIGLRVTTSDGHAGTITRVDRAWSYCYVRQDDTGREVSYLYSLLSSGGGGGSGGGGAAMRTQPADWPPEPTSASPTATTRS
jgi:hypothetical protein